MARPSKWRRAGTEVLAELELATRVDHDQLAAGVGEILSGLVLRGAAVSVVLADDLTRLWQVAPSPACARMSDLQAAASIRFHALFGAGMAGWRVAADWDASRPFLAAAAPEQLVVAIEATVRSHRGCVVEVVPQFVAGLSAWRRRLRPGEWFGQFHSGVLTLALFDGAALAAIRSVAVPNDTGRDWFDEHVAREALRVGTARPERVHICGPAPESWASLDGEEGCALLDKVRVEMTEAGHIACTGGAR